VEVKPAAVDEQLIAWHCVLKDAITPGKVDGQMWGRAGAKYYLLDHVHERLDLAATLGAILKMNQRWPDARLKAIHCKTQGARLFRRLAEEFPQCLMHPNAPRRNLIRADAVGWLLEAELLYLPHPAYEPWIHEFIEQCAQFPNGVRDEYVETMTAALRA